MYNIETQAIEDTREGKAQLLSNIAAWKTVSDNISKTLGPNGLDKMFVSRDNVLITNDGATIMKNKKFDHPAARLLASISESQDKEAGDGTTSVVLLASELLQKLKQLVKEDFSAQVIVETLEELKKFCIEKLDDLLVDFSDEILYKIAKTAMNSKILKFDGEQFAKIVVDGLREEKKMMIKKVAGGSSKDSVLIDGIAFEKVFTYAGYEQQPKLIKSPKIVCLNIELEWKAEKNNAEMKISGIEEYEKVVDAEWELITNKLKLIVESGANVVLSGLPIGDYATQYFARNNIFCAGRVPSEDLKQISLFCGAKITSSTNFMKIGSCEMFEEKQIGKKRFNFLTGIGKVTTVILRGPGNTALDEMERSLNDAVMVVKNTMKHKKVMCGGGSVEMALSKMVRVKASEYSNKQLFVATCVSQALEVVPFTLALNFGLDAVTVIQKLRKLHNLNNRFCGVDVEKGVAEMKSKNVFEPLVVKKNIIRGAFSAVSSLIMIDTTIIAHRK